ncbi:MAG: hypothetical protein N3E52_01180 [Candidatus Bathyarchaeota archaeon]|nr:hypothetical protein [Candidatus Bathyarchaeota archaeon]
MTLDIKKIWRNEYIQTVIVIGLVALFIFGFWYGLQIALNTPYPALAVISGSMCVPYNGACDGWSHPFSQTLHIGDLIIVQGVNPKELNANYPNSDIIVFKKPSNPDELIVHRIVAVNKINGTLYFRTKGDGNSHIKWPSAPSTLEYDPWDTNGVPGIREDYVVGKVIMRIPWLGHIVLFIRNSIGLPIIVVLIIILVLIEFIVPLLKENKNWMNNPRHRCIYK